MDIVSIGIAIGTLRNICFSATINVFFIQSLPYYEPFSSLLKNYFLHKKSYHRGDYHLSSLLLQDA